MSRRNNGSSRIAVFVVIGFLFVLGLAMDVPIPRCIEDGCKNEKAPNSSYCYWHKPHTGNNSYESKSSSYSTSTPRSSSTRSTRNSSGTTYSGKTSSGVKSYGTSKKSSYYSYGTSKKSSSYSSYDDGYDAVYDDGDYHEADLRMYKDKKLNYNNRK